MITGVLQDLIQGLFGRDRNLVVETMEVFRENAEAAGQRRHDHQSAALAQFAAEFTQPRKGRFDRFVDGLNRLPRPMLALGTLALLGAAMVDPLWFAARMQGLALVPEPLWWLLGVIVTFYFGARQQLKHQEFQQDIAGHLFEAPQVARRVRSLTQHDDAPEQDQLVEIDPDPLPEANPALQAWMQRKNRGGQ